MKNSIMRKRCPQVILFLNLLRRLCSWFLLIFCSYFKHPGMSFHLFNSNSFERIIMQRLNNKIFKLLRNLNSLWKPDNTFLNINSKLLLCSSPERYFSIDHLIQSYSKSPGISLFIINISC